MLYRFIKKYNIKIIKYTNLELEKKISQIKKKYKILKFPNIDIVVSQARKIISKKLYKGKKKFNYRAFRPFLLQI